MDTIGERTRRNELILTTEAEDMELWRLQQQILETDKNRWMTKQYLLKSAHLSVKHEEELLRIKEKVSRQKEKYWRNREELIRRKENRLEERLVKFGKNCLVESSLGSEGESSRQLLPGIPNDITLNKITTKLSWREVHLLKPVSRGWYSAIRNQLVYDARVHSHLTQTFVLAQHFGGPCVLRSLRDNSCFQLPRIPYSNSLIPHLVAVDGKVYLMGVLPGAPSDKIYMLDLAGQRSWTPCASMHTPRYDFQCGVMDGKIYVFGGWNFERSLCESEVYDPRENEWSLIAPKCSFGTGGYVATVGEEFFVYGGLLLGSESDGGAIEETNFLDIYHPVKDEWRQVKPFNPPEHGKLFGFEGKVYSMDCLGLSVYSFDENSWTHVCSHTFTSIHSINHTGDFQPYHVIASQGKLLAYGDLVGTNGYIRSILGIIGFDGQKHELIWREERGWALDTMLCSMCVVHL